MSTATTIIEGMVMEGKLDAGEAPVLLAGHFTGELNAVEVILDPSGVFNGQINARRVELSGNFNGKLVTEELTVGSTAVIDGDLKSNALVIELGAEVSGTIGRKSGPYRQAWSKPARRDCMLAINLPAGADDARTVLIAAWPSATRGTSPAI